jgi:TPP-dependent pyruvate/acetoin dehydrogenase alpha subunit
MGARPPRPHEPPALRSSTPDPVLAYRLMVRMRLVEEAMARAWADGLLPGEYHSGIGEEGINAGVLLNLGPDDALALDHRNTAPLVGRGTDPTSLMLEILGSDRGLNRGMAGHMHVVDPDVRAVADGLVGASAPLAVGAALAARSRRPGSVAVAFHGEAALNQGVLMEAYNLAVVWRLPVVFVCKDNRWSITTRSAAVTASTPRRRATALGLRAESARGDDVRAVHAAAGRLVRRAREGRGPGFLHVTCHRPTGHFEGDPVVRILRDPLGQARVLLPELRQAWSAGTSVGPAARGRGVAVLGARVGRAALDWGLGARRDPVRRARSALPEATATEIEADERALVGEAAGRARAAVAGRPVFGRPDRPGRR